MKIAIVYCPAVENSGGSAGSELVMPPIGICSLSAYLRYNGYPSDLFDLLLEFDTTVLQEDLCRPLGDLFAAARSDMIYDPAVLTNLRFYLGLNRMYLAREVIRLYEEIEHINPLADYCSPNPVRRFFAVTSDKLARYDTVGLSIVFDEQNIAALILARWIKVISPDTKIVVGGSGVRHGDWDDFASLIVRGDGEAALLSYIRSLGRSTNTDSCPLPAGDTAVSFHQDLDDFPTPDYKALFARHRYLTPVKIIPLAVTRGCYWSKCLFCSFGWQKHESTGCTAPYRKMSATKVVADIVSQILENKTRYFFFSVDVMDTVLIEQIADELLRIGAEIFWSTEMRAEKQLLKPHFFEKMFKAGCRSATCGYESFNQRVLDSMQKGIKVEHSKAILDGLCDAGIYPSVGYFMGWPGETPSEAAETQKSVNHVFKRVPGTAAERFVLVKNSPVMKMGTRGTWKPLRYDRDRRRWLKQGMSWDAQNRQWLLFAINFYCDSTYSCFSVRGDGGYGLLYGARHPLSTLGRLFRLKESSFGLLGKGRLIFYGFLHTRHYISQSGARFNYDGLLRDCSTVDTASEGETTRVSKVERLDSAYTFVKAFINAHRFSEDEAAFIEQVARFDDALLRSCIQKENLPLVDVDEIGELVAMPQNSRGISFVQDFTIDIEQVVQFTPFEYVAKNTKCPVLFNLNGYHVLGK